MLDEVVQPDAPATGPLRLVTLVSREPLTVKDVESRLATRPPASAIVTLFPGAIMRNGAFAGRGDDREIEDARDGGGDVSLRLARRAGDTLCGRDACRARGFSGGCRGGYRARCGAPHRRVRPDSHQQPQHQPRPPGSAVCRRRRRAVPPALHGRRRSGAGSPPHALRPRHRADPRTVDGLGPTSAPGGSGGSPGLVAM